MMCRYGGRECDGCMRCLDRLEIDEDDLYEGDEEEEEEEEQEEIFYDV